MKRELEDLTQILGFIEVGTADSPKRIRRIDLAVQRCHEWRAERLISGDSSRGGSSSPAESDDRKEDRALNDQISRDLIKLQRALDSIAELPAIRQAVARYTEIIDLQKLPKKAPTDVVPGCVSCARSEQKGRVRIGGHFAPAMPAHDERVEGKKIHGNAEANRRRICRWCWDVLGATGQLPPIEACHIMHTESARAAGNWMARQGKAA